MVINPRTSAVGEEYERSLQDACYLFARASTLFAIFANKIYIARACSTNDNQPIYARKCALCSPSRRLSLSVTGEPIGELVRRRNLLRFRQCVKIARRFTEAKRALETIEILSSVRHED